jgi:ATP-dependent Zn protease
MDVFERPDVAVLRALAVHESGHLVIASRLGMHVRKVELAGTDAGLDGYSHVDHSRARLVDWIAVLLSGQVAEQFIIGAQAATRPHLNSDAERIALAMAQASPGQRAMAEQKAWSMVRSHSRPISGLAAALVDRIVTTCDVSQVFEISVGGGELVELLGGSAVVAILRSAI